MIVKVNLSHVVNHDSMVVFITTYRIHQAVDLMMIMRYDFKVLEYVMLLYILFRTTSVPMKPNEQ